MIDEKRHQHKSGWLWAVYGKFSQKISEYLIKIIIHNLKFILRKYSAVTLQNQYSQ